MFKGRKHKQTIDVVAVVDGQWSINHQWKVCDVPQNLMPSRHKSLSLIIHCWLCPLPMSWMTIGDASHRAGMKPMNKKHELPKCSQPSGFLTLVQDQQTVHFLKSWTHLSKQKMTNTWVQQVFSEGVSQIKFFAWTQVWFCDVIKEFPKSALRLIAMERKSEIQWGLEPPTRVCMSFPQEKSNWQQWANSLTISSPFFWKGTIPKPIFRISDFSHCDKKCTNFPSPSSHCEKIFCHAQFFAMETEDQTQKMAFSKLCSSLEWTQCFSQATAILKFNLGHLHLCETVFFFIVQIEFERKKKQTKGKARESPNWKEAQIANWTIENPKRHFLAHVILQMKGNLVVLCSLKIEIVKHQERHLALSIFHHRSTNSSFDLRLCSLWTCVFVTDWWGLGLHTVSFCIGIGKPLPHWQCSHGDVQSDSVWEPSGKTLVWFICFSCWLVLRAMHWMHCRRVQSCERAVQL